MIYSSGANAPFSLSLYTEAFGGSLAEAEADLSALIHGGAIPFSLSSEGEALSQGIGIPLWADTACPVLYLYALTTARPARGQGLLRTLLKEVGAHAKRSAYSSLCLLPADDALSQAYRRMGFTESRPAGGAPNPCEEGGLALRFSSVPDFEPCASEELWEFFDRFLSHELFAFALSSLGEGLIPCRVGEGYAILSRNDHTRALAVSRELTELVTREGRHSFLLAPLGNTLPTAIPEPLPR